MCPYLVIVPPKKRYDGIKVLPTTGSLACERPAHRRVNRSCLPQWCKRESRTHPPTHLPIHLPSPPSPPSPPPAGEAPTPPPHQTLSVVPAQDLRPSLRPYHGGSGLAAGLPATPPPPLRSRDEIDRVVPCLLGRSQGARRWWEWVKARNVSRSQAQASTQRHELHKVRARAWGPGGGKGVDGIISVCTYDVAQLRQAGERVSSANTSPSPSNSEPCPTNQSINQTPNQLTQ